MLAEKRKLGEVLLDANLITKEQLESALEEKERSGKLIGSILVEMNFLAAKDLLQALEIMFRVPSIDLDMIELQTDILKILPAKIAHKYLVIPIAKDEKRLTLAMVNPNDTIVKQDLRAITNLKIRPVVAPEFFIRNALEKYYPMKKEDLSLLSLPSIEEKTAIILDRKPITKSLSRLNADLPVGQLISNLLLDATNRGATYIHCEPLNNKMRFRNRVGGALQTILEIPKERQEEITNWLKKIAQLDLMKTNIPQEGRVRIKIGEQNVELEIHTFPVLNGEQITLKLWYKSSHIAQLEDLGMTENVLDDYRQLISTLKGTILIIAPDNFGKTTTLYASAVYLNSPTRSVFLLEHPIEYRLEEIAQGIIEPATNMDFTSVFKSILKQDPDVLVINNLHNLAIDLEYVLHSGRDRRLVLASIDNHSYSYEFIHYLEELGISPFLIASSLNAILVQRLVRNLCSNCKKPYTPSNDLLKELGVLIKSDKKLTFYEPVGCAICGNTGYIGYTALYELLIINDNIRQTILRKRPSKEIKAYALKEGMSTLQKDGFIKVYLGKTSLDEVLRVAYAPS